MSEARAGHIPYTGTPDVGATFAQPEYQRIEANPREFGAQIGAGLESVGQGLQKVSDVYSDVAAQQATTNWRKQVNNILFGDPNVPGDVGYYGLHGQAAMDARSDTLQKIEAAAQQSLGTLGTSRSQILFNNEARYYQARVESEIGVHYDNESKVWGETVNNDQYQNAIADAALRPQDENAATDALSRANEARVRHMQIMGQLPADLSQATPEQLGVFHRETRQSSIDVLESRIRSLIGRGDTDAASTLFNQNQALLSESKSFDALSAHLQQQHDAAVGQRLGMGDGINFGGTGGGQNNPGNIRVPGSTGTEKSAFQSFPTPEAGVSAISRNLDAYADQHGINTLRGVISRWAPPSENDTERLIHQASQRTNLGPDEVIDIHDPQVKAQLVSAIVQQEQGHPADPALVQRAVSGGSDIAPAVQQIQQTNPNLLHVPGLYDRLVQIENSDATPRQKNIGVEVATRLYNAQWSDQERARTMRNQAIEDTSKAREKDIISDALSGQPQITAQTIANDPKLTPEAQLRMLGFIKTGANPVVSPGLSQHMAMQLVDDMRLPAGDPRRVNDTTPITDAYSQGKLTREDYSFAMSQFENLRSPDGVKLGDMQREFIKGMQSSITRSNPLMGQLDREGDQKLYQFNWMVNHKVSEYRQAGKNPFDLFDPAKPDYLGSPEALRPFATSLQQSIQHQSDALGLAVPAPTLQPGAPATPAAPTIMPRRQGETMQQWIARTNQGLPGIERPAVQP